MARAELQTNFREVDGTRIAYLDAGTGDPVVFVHGNFASKRWFRMQLENPAPGYRFLAPDLPNFGESGPLADEPILENYARKLEGLLGTLGIDRFVLVGHSLGGAVAQTIAVEHPTRVAGLFLVASPPPSGFDVPEGTEARQKELAASAESMSAALAATMPTHRPNDYEEIVSDALGVSVDVYGPHNRALAAMDLTGQTQRVACPVLVLRCEMDYLITEAMARETASAYPDSELVLWEGVGHSPQIEAPSRFDALLAEFLEGVAMT